MTIRRCHLKSKLKLNDVLNNAIATQETFNPTRLAFARRRRGFTKIGLAKKLGVDVRAVTAYEGGEYPPSPEVLGSISLELDFPSEFFFGDNLDDPDPEIVSFRALSKMSAKVRDMALTQGGIGVHLCRWIEKRFQLPENDLPDLSYESSPESGAETLRSMWGLGQLPIRNVVHLLEAKGVRIFSLAVEAREVDAFSMWQDQTPFLFLNGMKSSEHSRYDAAHELGHLVLHKHGGPRGRIAEIEANSFASAFLMPRRSVLAHPPRAAILSEMLRLKKIWLTSVIAVSHRLHAVGLITDWQYHRLCQEIACRGFRTREPEECPKEVSQILPAVLVDLYKQDGISRSRIGKELGVSSHELEALLFGFVPQGVNGGRTSPLFSGASSRLSLVK